MWQGPHVVDGRGPTPRVRPPVAERTQPQAAQPKDVAASHEPPAAADAFELNLTAFDDDDRVPPLGFVEVPLATGRDRKLPTLERRRKTSGEEASSPADRRRTNDITTWT